MSLSLFHINKSRIISHCLALVPPREEGGWGGGGGGGGSTPLYQLYRYVPPKRVWLLSHFGLKTGIDFDHYGLKSAMVFKGTTRANKRIYLFNSK